MSPPQPKSAAHRVANALVGLAVGTLAAAVLSEAIVRTLRPTPRTQVVDTRSRPITWVDDRPLWEAEDTVARAAPPCADGAIEVAMVGSSITYGTDVPRADTVAARLAARLGPAWCVRNFGQPGFTGEQKRIQAERAIAEHHPAVLVYEIWRNDASEYLRIGDVAVSVGDMHTDAAGWPAAPVPTPMALHHLLLERSAAWRYATIALAGVGDPHDPQAWPVRVPGYLQRVHDTLGTDGKLLVWIASRLNEPLAMQAERNPTAADVGHVFTWASTHGVPVVDPAVAWTGLDPATLGIDTVCHLNRTGADALAALLEPEVRRLTAEVVKPPQLGAVDPRVAAHTATIAAELPRLTEARLRCQALVYPVRPSDVWEAPAPWDLAALDAACGEIGAAYDRLAPVHGGVTRSTDVLFTHLARVADDLDYLRRSLDVHGHERTNSLQHVHDALGWQTATERAWVRSDHRPYDDGLVLLEDSWMQAQHEDSATSRQLRDALDRLGLAGANPVNVRRRMLDSFVRVPTGMLAARRAALARTPDDAKRRARTAYLDAWEAWFDTAVHAVEAARAGHLNTNAALAAEIAALDQATTVWAGVKVAAP